MPSVVGSKAIVRLDAVSHSVAGETVLEDFHLTVGKGEKIAVVSRNSVATTALLEIP